MKNYRRSLPPLDYLLFFEAAARHGSFTEAARELNVSQAAVSKRVRILEQYLALNLVNRNGRNVTLSRSGRELGTCTSEALDYLNTCIANLRPSIADRLAVAANSAVAQYWLSPRINEYLLGAQTVPITLSTSHSDKDLFSFNTDAIIFYGESIPKGWEGEHLFREVMVPLVAPALVEQGVDWRHSTLLDYDKLTPKWIDWASFAELTGNEEIKLAKKVNLGSYLNTLDTAIRGKGIALGSAEILQCEIDAKRLVALSNLGLDSGRNYFVIWRKGSLSEGLKIFLAAIGIEV